MKVLLRGLKAKQLEAQKEGTISAATTQVPTITPEIIQSLHFVKNHCKVSTLHYTSALP